MPDENGTEEIRPDAPSADDALFGDAAEKTGDADATPTDVQDVGGNSDQVAQGSVDTEDKSVAAAEVDAAEELRVVVSIMGGRAVIGIKQPSSDPHIETFDDHDLPALAQEVVAVTERAKAKWEETPKHPTHERPAPPPRRQRRRQQGAAQEATAETGTEQTRQQTLNLF